MALAARFLFASIALQGLAGVSALRKRADDNGPKKKVIPQVRYSCELDVAWFENTTVDRWVSVTPRNSLIADTLRWLNPLSWWSWIEYQMGLTDADDSPNFDFDPFVLRGRPEYTDVEMVKAVEVATNNVTCETTYVAHCSDAALLPGDPKPEKLQILQEKTCFGPNMNTTVEVDTFYMGSMAKVLTVCPHEIQYDFGWWGTGRTLDVYVGEKGSKLEYGHCVDIGSIDPAIGIDLGKLDYDMMGLGEAGLRGNASKVDRIVNQLNDTLKGMYDGLLEQGALIGDGIGDVFDVVNEYNQSFINGSEAAVHKAVKWIKIMTLSTMVETCLCCDSEVVETNESVSDHCMYAYTLGGENKSQTLKYMFKSAAGTIYNLAQTAGGWLVPVLGGNIVKESHKRSCHFTCGIRKGYLYEPYKYGKVRKVPGLAFQTWFIPNPSSFWDAAASGAATGIADDIVTSGVANGAANAVVTDVVGDAVGR